LSPVQHGVSKIGSHVDESGKVPICGVHSSAWGGGHDFPSIRPFHEYLESIPKFFWCILLRFILLEYDNCFKKSQFRDPIPMS
jgi:hypothetical protein